MKPLFISIVILLFIFLIVTPAQAFIAKDLTIAVQQNGDAEIGFKYQLSWIEVLAIRVGIANLQNELTKALENNFNKPVIVIRADASEAQFTVSEFASVKSEKDSITFTTPSLSFSAAEKVLKGYMFAPLISTDFSPSITQVTFPDGYTKEFYDQITIPRVEHTVEKYIQPIEYTIPSHVLSPVIGTIGFTNCCASECPKETRIFNKWEFCQHKTGFKDTKFGVTAWLGHLLGGGIGYADDSFAWDVNLNYDTKRDADNGIPVYAVAPGTVALRFGQVLPNSRIIDNNGYRICPQNIEYTNANNAGTGEYGQVLIDHSGWYSGYLHMNPIFVSPGQKVTENTIIGKISHKGVPDGNNHLHFVVYNGENTACGLKSFNVEIIPR